jgi:hypothetical protein
MGKRRRGRGISDPAYDKKSILPLLLFLGLVIGLGTVAAFYIGVRFDS